MKKRIPVQGITATAPRPTRAAAVLVASAVSVAVSGPVFILLTLIEWAWV